MVTRHEISGYHDARCMAIPENDVVSGAERRPLKIPKCVKDGIMKLVPLGTKPALLAFTERFLLLVMLRPLSSGESLLFGFVPCLVFPVRP